jgi:hypothetical protein
MATRNIARTAIEGGRSKHNKHERWQSNRNERRAVSMALRLVTHDPEAEEGLALPVREPVMKDFADKLKPAYRWLGKRAEGMTPNQIRSLLLNTFNTRTLAGRHLVLDHLMPQRYYNDSTRWSASIYLGYATYAFDADDILRHIPKHGVPKAAKKLRIRARQWLKTLRETDRIGKYDGGYAIFTPLDYLCEVECTNPLCTESRTPVYVEATKRVVYMTIAHPKRRLNGSLDPVPFHTVRAYKLERKLSENEARFWRTAGTWKFDLDRNR